MADENQGDDVERDLFGAPVSQIRDRWGRPSFKKTKENQQLVAGLAARGYSSERIAVVLKCDPKTVRKHFSRELAHGADLIEADAIAVLIHKMNQGHAPSVGRILELLSEGRMPPKSAQQQKPEPMGKKAAAAAAARDDLAEWDFLPH